MREVILGLREPQPEAVLNQVFVVTTGVVLEEPGEIMDPDKDALLIVAPNEYQPRTYAYRPWHMAIGSCDLKALTVDVNKTCERRAPAVGLVTEIPEKPIVIGRRANLPGVARNLVKKVVQPIEVLVIPRSDGIRTSTDVRKSLKLKFIGDMTKIEQILSRAVGEPTTIHKMTGRVGLAYMQESERL